MLFVDELDWRDHELVTGLIQVGNVMQPNMQSLAQ